MNKSVRNSLLGLILGLANVAMAGAEGLAQTAVTNANTVIDAVIAVYGGDEAISDLVTVSIDNNSDTSAVGQSRKPGTPYDRDKASGTAYIDYKNQIFVSRNEGTGGGNQFDFSNVINAEDSYNINYLAKTATPLAQPDFNTASGPFVRVTPPLLVKQLQERRHTSHWLGVENVDGRPHDVITLVMEVGPGLTLYFDQKTRLLNKSERILPPFGTVSYRFRDHREVAGIPFNMSFELLVNGANNLNRVNSKVEVNKPRENIAALPTGVEVGAPQEPDEMGINTIGEGVYLVGGGGAYSLFVEMEDYVFAAGATQGAALRIAELRKVIPKKPIRYALLTHHHNDHIPGAADFAAQNAVLLTVAPNETVVRQALGDDKATLEFVDGKRTISDGNRTVEIRNIGPTPHAEDLLVVYLPQQGVVFEADHFSLPLNGSLPSATNNSRALAAAIKDWEFDYLVGAHSPAKASKDDFLKAASGGGPGR